MTLPVQPALQDHGCSSRVARAPAAPVITGTQLRGGGAAARIHYQIVDRVGIPLTDSNGRELQCSGKTLAIAPEPRGLGILATIRAEGNTDQGQTRAVRIQQLSNARDAFV